MSIKPLTFTLLLLALLLCAACGQLATEELDGTIMLPKFQTNG